LYSGIKLEADEDEFWVDFTFDLPKFRRVRGFVIKSADGEPENNPETVTVEWDLELNKPTKAMTYTLDLQEKWQENYFDLPDFNLQELEAGE